MCTGENRSETVHVNATRVDSQTLFISFFYFIFKRTFSENRKFLKSPVITYTFSRITGNKLKQKDHGILKIIDDLLVVVIVLRAPWKNKARNKTFPRSRTKNKGKK